MWITAKECAGIGGLPTREHNVRARLDRVIENKPELRRKREGTKAFEYHIDCLPAEAQKVLRKRLTHQVLEDAQLPAVVEQKAVKNVAVRDELEVMVKCPELALREVQALTDKQKAIADARILLAIGVVLAGMPRLLINLKGRRGEFAQLYSRVALALNLGDTLAQEDFNQIATGLMPEAAEPEISEALYARSLGNARRLFKLARGVYRICDISDAPVSVQAIDKFAEMLIH